MLDMLSSINANLNVRFDDSNLNMTSLDSKISAVSKEISAVSDFIDSKINAVSDSF